MSPSIHDVTQLLQWKSKSKQQHGPKAPNEASIKLALDLLADDSSLADVEAQLHVAQTRLLQAILEYAVFTTTYKSGDTMQSSPQSFHLLSLALRRTQTYQLSLQSCSQLLLAIVSVLQQHAAACAVDAAAFDDALIESVSTVFVRLFENTSTAAFAPRFGVFKPPTDVYATFLKDSVASLVAISAAIQSDTVAHVVLAILQVHHSLQKNQSNKKKVFLACKQSLGTFVTLRASMEPLRPFSDPMIDSLDLMVADALFDNEHLHGYGGLVVGSQHWPAPASTGDVDDAPPSKKKAKGGTNKAHATAKSYQHQLFDQVRTLLVDDPSGGVAEFVQMLVRQYVTYIRRATLSHDRNDPTTPDAKKRKAADRDTMTPAFTFWLDMCDVNMDVYGASSPSSTIHVWLRLWEAMNASDIYRVAEDNTAQHQFHYLERVVASVMDHLSNSSSATRGSVADETALLANMVQCSPKILQLHLARVFAYVAQHGADAVAECGTCLARLIESYDAMRLLEEFLGTLFEVADCAPVCGLFHQHAALEATSRTAFAHVPMGQVESLWLFFHDVLYRAVKAASIGRVQLIRTVFGLYIQEVPVSQHIQAPLLACAKQTFDLVLWPPIANAGASSYQTSSKKMAAASTSDVVSLERETLSLMGDLLELTDKSVDTSFVIHTCFASPDFLDHVASSIIVDASAASASRFEAGVLKLCATRVRQLVSSFDRGTDARAVASFVLAAATRLGTYACITPFLSELGASASPDVCAAFVDAISRAAMAHTLTPHLFLDAQLYEIRPFLHVLPIVFTNILTARTCALWQSTHATTTLAALVQRKYKKSRGPVDAAAAAALLDAVAFMSTVPIPFLAGTERDGLVAAMLEIESILHNVPTTADNDAVASTLTALYAWLESFLAAVAAPFEPSVLAVLDTWTAAFFARAVAPSSSVSSSLVRAIVRVYVTFHPKQMQPLNDLVVAKLDDAVLSPWTMTLVSLAVRGWASSNHANGEHFFAALAPRLRPRFEQAADASTLLDVYASMLHFDLVRAKTRDAALLASLGPMLASACRALAASADPAALRLVLVVCSNFRSLADGPTHALSLATYGRLVAALLAPLAHSAAPAAALELLLTGATASEFHLVWHTLTTEIQQNEAPARVLAGLRGMLSVLRLEKLAPHKRLLTDSAKTTLAHLVNLCPATTAPTAVHAAALQVVVQALSKPEAFGWHASDVQTALLALRPIEAISSQSSFVAALLDDDAALSDVWQQSYLLLLRLLRQYSSSLPHYLPHFVVGCNALLRALLHVAASSSSSSRIKLLHLWASNLTRLYGYMIPHSVSFRKHMVYLLAEFFYNHSNDTLSHDVQQTLRPGIYALFDICSKYEKEQLYGTLDSTGKILLKSMDAHYKETHQYTGKV
ncbi:Aste57867_23034 [Aphanomyces stellatus]|uniref:Aste57867_23034 protein n=1 Tax=Aphanomyces stellatus TaxID=120398 RepID=A0A485LMH0_9STRA|nr:hypothetical protein As57867_022963 [Aphanomyces stellatus]VFT99682.1 Aste57867_23034 [Aphanomyces stellatus]